MTPWKPEDLARMRQHLLGPSLAAALAPHVPPGVRRVLDIGCGEGSFTRFVAAVLCPEAEVTGLDLDQAMLDAARAAGPGPDFRRGDAASLPYPPASFDLVTAHTALAVLADPQAAVGESCRVLRPGGVLLAVERPGGRGGWPALDTPASPRFPQAPELDALRRAANEGASDGGHSAAVVADLPGLLYRAGLREVRVDGFAAAIWSGAAGPEYVAARHGAEAAALAARGAPEPLVRLCTAYTAFLLEGEHLWSAGEVEWKPRLIVSGRKAA